MKKIKFIPCKGPRWLLVLASNPSQVLCIVIQCITIRLYFVTKKDALAYRKNSSDPVAVNCVPVKIKGMENY